MLMVFALDDRQDGTSKTTLLLLLATRIESSVSRERKQRSCASAVQVAYFLAEKKGAKLGVHNNDQHHHLCLGLLFLLLLFSGSRMFYYCRDNVAKNTNNNNNNNSKFRGCCWSKEFNHDF
jgi:hypothetical protein